MNRTHNTEVGIMDLFPYKKEKVHNLITAEKQTIRHLIYETPSNGQQYIPTLALFNEDETLLLTYINEEAYYPTLYKIVHCCKTTEKDGYYVETDFLEDYTDKLLGNEMYEQLVGKGFHIRDVLIFKAGLLRLRCLNETRQLMESLNEEVKKIEEDFTELTSVSTSYQAEVSMCEMSNRMDGYREEVEKGYLNGLKDLINNIITEKY